ncbi:hypothetical protein [Streptosporangium sp. NPDC000396]|uniref:hypothetical protein n=1 Tax=Streptosporangium sp. NPDC000396 TaxID=3366185 RepID=UPI003698FC75
MTRLHDALTEIAGDAPMVNLADRAISGSRRRRRTNAILAAAATALVAVLGTGVGTGLLPSPLSRSIAASQHGPYWWEIASSPLPDRGVTSLSYAYLTSCESAAPPKCKGRTWRVVTRDGKTYDVPQAAGSSGSATAPLTITPDGRTMAYYSRQEQTFKVRDLKSGKELTAPMKVPPRQLDTETFLRLSDNGRYLAFTAFRGDNQPGLLVDMRNGGTSTLPAGWMPVSIADDGDPAVMVNWKDTSSQILLMSPGNRKHTVTIPRWSQEFSALAPDKHTMAEIGMDTKTRPIKQDGTLLVFDAVSGKVTAKVAARGLPEDTVMLRLGNWLNDTEVVVLTIPSSEPPSREDSRTAYAMNIKTGQVRKLQTYQVPGAYLTVVPGIVW